MRSDGQPAADRRPTVLVPEAFIPHQPDGRARWGLWVALLLTGMVAGIVLAWSLGLMRGGEDIVPVAPVINEPLAPPIATRSPYPTELPDLSGRGGTQPVPDLPPVAPPLVEQTPPPRFEPAPLSNVVAPITTSTVSRRVPPVTPRAPAPTAAVSGRALTAETAEPPRPVRRTTVTPLRPSLSQRPSLPATRPVAATAARSLTGPLPALFAPGDYPPASRRAGEQGDVTVRLTISPAGRVTRCAVLASNTSESLEAATCAVLSRRSRFAPATDTTGTATGGAVVQHIAWRSR